MNEKQELFGTSFRKAQGVLDTIKQHRITPDMDAEAIKALVIKLAQAKVDLDGGKLSDYVSGQEWYVRSLITKSALTDRELIDGEYKSLLVDNSSLEELASMLKR